MNELKKKKYGDLTREHKKVRPFPFPSLARVNERGLQVGEIKVDECEEWISCVECGDDLILVVPEVDSLPVNFPHGGGGRFSNNFF